MTDRQGTNVDLHVKVLDEQVVERAKRRGLDALVYAPHFTRLTDIERRAEQFSDDDLLIIPAREVFAGHWQTRRHVLALGLSDPIPDFISLDGLMAELRRQDATVLVPHPEFFSVSLSVDEIREYRDVVDGIDVYNPKHFSHHNRRARRIASALELPGYASSYAHLRGTIGEAWTVFDRELSDTADLLAAISAGEFRPVRRNGRGHRMRCLAEFCHLGWENSWQKLDRVFLSGTEPTHPDHVAYDGRFDDVRVY